MNKIIHGNNIEIMKQLIDEGIKINTIVTSPPYNLKGFKEGNIKPGGWHSHIEYDNFDDNLPEEEYQRQQIEFLNICYDLIPDNGSMFYNHKNRRYKNKVSTPYEWILKSKFNIYQEIIWDRQGSPDNNKLYFMDNTEKIFWLTKIKPKTFRNQLEKRFKINIWSIHPGKKEYNHPAPYPTQIPLNCILMTTEEGDTVLDPYVGSGSTIEACIKTKRNYLGIDISEKYVIMTEERNNIIKGKKLRELF